MGARPEFYHTFIRTSYSHLLFTARARRGSRRAAEGDPLPMDQMGGRGAPLIHMFLLGIMMLSPLLLILLSLASWQQVASGAAVAAAPFFRRHIQRRQEFQRKLLADKLTQRFLGKFARNCGGQI